MNVVGRPNDTVGATRDEESVEAQKIPGVIVIVEKGLPAFRVVPMLLGKLGVGREGSGIALDDERASREHAEITFARGAFAVKDLSSRNGTLWEGNVVRIGQSLMLLEPDLRRFGDGLGVSIHEGMVIGPTLREAQREIDLAAHDGATLLITGESGAGKELAARRYHLESPHKNGPKVDLNCAAIPRGVAESVLFGAVRGAFTGATETTKGCIAEADRGVLFLDEIGELDLEIQAKLLRVLETKQVAPVGGQAAKKIDVFVCAATNRDLRTEVTKGRFREDLYYRLAQHTVRLPALRDRREEIPSLITEALRAIGPKLTAHPKLFEACLLRPWPGNVRELLAEIRRIGRVAIARDLSVASSDLLEERAGQPLAPEATVEPSVDEADPERQRVIAVLAEQDGNVAAAARVLGLHRNQLYRVMKRHGIGGGK